ncbi:MAG: RNA 2',3'-cyclic phosphodiesterase [Desulfobacterales bacterium]|nr:RNA 2',3'-cyclic phosphodiesterase [Desulfobacterales bacterium]
MEATLRAFIAIELPEKIILSLGRLQESLKAEGLNIRWVRPENIHLTLKFLGGIPFPHIEKIRDAVCRQADGFAPMTLSAKGVGVFPDPRRPRVMWVGLAGQTGFLTRLQKLLDEELAAIHYPRENRAFTGHLTLGRVKGPMDPLKLTAAMENHGGFESGSFVADHIVLFNSELRPSGAVYSKLLQVKLQSRTQTD